MASPESARARRRRREQAIDFLLRNEEATQSAAHRRAFEAWLANDPQNAAAYEEARRLMGEARSAIETDPALKALQPKRRSPTRRKLVTAGIAVGITAALFVAFDGPMRLRADVIAETGEMPSIRLADGSMMQLNSGSAAAYDLDGRERIVRLLRGEAYFEVAPDRERPFVVEAMGARATALGTAFNVRLADDAADVAVVEHAVEVASSGPAKSTVRVQAGQEVACCADGRVGAVRAVDPAIVLAWRRGELVVDNATLASVVEEIGRHFAGRIVIAPGGLAQRRVSGTFAVSDPDAALDLLRQSLGLEITRLGPLVIIRG